MTELLERDTRTERPGAARRAPRSLCRACAAELAAAVHELRAPVSHIKGFVSTLRQPDVEWDDATRAEFLAELEREADRLADLIADLLDLGSVERGHLDLVPTAPAVLADAALDRVRGRLADHPVEVDVPNDLPSVPVDAPRVERLLANLLENAAKYSQPGSPIAVWARPRLPYLQIAVDDAGPGIPPHLLGRVFDRFFRAPSAGASAAGTGLGLAIARSIAVAHGGRLHAENRPAGGARFLLSLPVAAPASRT